MFSNTPSLCLASGLDLNSHGATFVDELDIPGFLSHGSKWMGANRL